MQTFLPYRDFRECARVLDRQRLGKQRVECLQILNSLYGKSKGWTNHPAVLMWKNCEGLLVEYGLKICVEWINLGYKDTCYEKILSYYKPNTSLKPFWFDDNRIFSSHRSALLAKDYNWYKQFGWQESPIIDYWWPKKIEKGENV